MYSIIQYQQKCNGSRNEKNSVIIMSAGSVEVDNAVFV